MLPPGSRVVTGIAPLHHDGRFHERANRFEPDRYVGKKPDTYAWIPFGGGMRRCLGAAFAQFEIDIVLRTLLRNFELATTTRAGRARKLPRRRLRALEGRRGGGPPTGAPLRREAGRAPALITALNS